MEGASAAPGRYDESLHLDGEQDCISIPASASLSFDEEFSIETWVRPDPEGAAEGPLITQEDKELGEGEEPYADSLPAGNEEGPPEALLRIQGEQSLRKRLRTRTASLETSGRILP